MNILNKNRFTFDLLLSLIFLISFIFLLQAFLFSLNYVSHSSVYITSLIHILILFLSLGSYLNIRILNERKILIQFGLFIVLWLYILFVSNIFKNAFEFLSQPFLIVQLLISLLQFQILKISNFSSEDLSKNFVKKINLYLPLGFLVLLNSYYVAFNYAAPLWDQSRHAWNVLKIYNMITQGSTGVVDGFLHYDLYPSLSYLVACPFLFLFGKSYNAMVLSIPLFWLPLAYLFFYKLVNKYLRCSANISSALTFTFFSSCFLMSITKSFWLEFPILTILILYIYFLFSSNFLTKRKHAFVSGLIFSLGLLTKENFILFALIPLVFAIFRIVIKIIRGKKVKFIFYYFENLLLHFLGIISIASVWYLCWSGFYFFGMSTQDATARSEGDPYPYSLDSALWYLKALVFMLTLPVLVILFFGMIRIIIVKKYQFLKILSVVSFVFIYLVATLQWNKDARYVVGILFFLLPAYLGIFQFPLNSKKFFSDFVSKSLIVFLLMWSLLTNVAQCFNVELPIPFYRKGPYYATPVPAPPSTLNIPEAFASFSYLYGKAYGKGESDKPVIKQDFHNSGGVEFSDHNQRLYEELYEVKKHVALYDSAIHDKIKFNKFLTIGNNSVYIDEEVIKNEHLLFYRDKFYPCYYLFKARIDSGFFYLQKIGFTGKIKGDLRAIIFIPQKDTVKSVEFAFQNNLKVAIPSDVSWVTIDIKLTHSHGSPQLDIIDKWINPYPQLDMDWDNSLEPLHGGLFKTLIGKKDFSK